MIRVGCVALMNTIAVVATIFGAAYAVQPAYGIGFHTDVYLWIPVLGNTLAVLVIPFVGNLSDRIGRRPPIIVGALGSGLLSFVYLYAISIGSVPLAIVHVAPDVGARLPGIQRDLPELLPGDVSGEDARVGMAISQNIGTMISALMPALFALDGAPGIERARSSSDPSRSV